MIGLLPRGTFVALLMAFLVFAAVRYAPVYFVAWQFHDAIRQDVKFAWTSRDPLEAIRKEILLHAETFDIPLEKDGIEMTSDGPFFVVRIRYAVPIDLRVFQHDLKFDWSLSGERFQ